MSTKRIVTLAVALMLAGTALAAPPARHVTFNGRPATALDLTILKQLEARWGQPLADGDYWYDNRSGAAGTWGGPAMAFLPAGLGLGGDLPANASGGGTGVFVNGRELHPLDLQRLMALVGPIQGGRYWVDAQGNAGPEGRPAVVNLVQLANRQGGVAPGGRPGDGCAGHMGPYVTIRRGNEVASSCRALGHTVGQTYHNGDGYYIDVQ
jgi:hypothetical protein